MIRAIVLAGATAFAFGVLYQVAWRMVTISAVIAALAWTAYQAILGSFSGSTGWAEFCGALAVGVLSELGAFVLKQPALVLQVPSIIPFVPGYLVYESVLSFMRNHFLIGLEQGFRALMLAAALGLGLAMATAATRALIRREGKSEGNNEEKTSSG